MTQDIINKYLDSIAIPNIHYRDYLTNEEQNIINYTAEWSKNVIIDAHIFGKSQDNLDKVLEKFNEIKSKTKSLPDSNLKEYLEHIQLKLTEYNENLNSPEKEADALHFINEHFDFYHPSSKKESSAHQFVKVIREHIKSKIKNSHT